MKIATIIFILINILPLEQVSATSIYHVEIGKEIDEGNQCASYYKTLKLHKETDFDSIQRGIQKIGIEGNFLQVMKKELPEIVNRTAYLPFEVKAVEPITIEFNNSNVINADSLSKSKNLAKKIAKIKNNRLEKIKISSGKSFKGAITVKGFCGSNETEKFQQKEKAIQKFVKIKTKRRM